MRKFRYYIDFEKEEKWLNEMAKEGWKFSGKAFGYMFNKTIPTNTVIKIDYRTFAKTRDFQDYITLFKDSGWEHIAGTKISGVQYFKKVSESDDTEIFSDTLSKAGRYKRLSNMWLSIATSYITLFIILFTRETVDFSALLNPKQLYYTPGLWDKTGVGFWGRFLFETPFVIMRSFVWLVFPISIIIYLIFMYKAEKCYRRTNLK